MTNPDTYALWIIPEGTAYTLTDGYIGRLSKMFDLPKFEPHVTVLAGIPDPDLSTLRDLTRGLPPFRIRLASQAEYLDEFFRCLFLRADKTPALMEAFSKVSLSFGYEGPPYFPHLSLAYGDLLVETKHEMIRTLGDIPEIEFEARQLSLVMASSKIPISSWRVIEHIPLILS
jgi:2'-5' RNA ligase